MTDGCVWLAASLSAASKLDLIAQLNVSVQSDIARRENSFTGAFGIVESAQAAEEISEELRTQRTLTRQIESF